MSQDPRGRALGALSQFLVAEASLGDTLHRVSEIATDAVPSAAMVGITLLDTGGQPTTPVYTHETAPSVDDAQYESGRGPCLDAWRERRVVRVDDTAAAADYPEFGKVAQDHGIHSTLSFPLVAGAAAVGALNLYARTTAAFSPDDEAVGIELATTVAAVLVNATAYWGAAQLGEQLTEAMRSRAVIEQAKGMLMAHSPAMTPDDAFDLLRRASQRENVKLREIAQRIVDRQPMTARRPEADEGS